MLNSCIMTPDFTVGSYCLLTVIDTDSYGQTQPSGVDMWVAFVLCVVIVNCA